MKIVRTDCELEVPIVDAALRDAGYEVVLLADGITEDRLCAEVADADLILMCYTPITRRVIAAAALLQRNPVPSRAEIEDAIQNMCRCGVYPRLVSAIQRAGRVAQRGEHRGRGGVARPGGEARSGHRSGTR